MIKLIYGPKGTGKTKKLIDSANAEAQTAKGLSVFITNTKRYMYDLNRAVRFIDVNDWDIAGEDALCGFVKGVAACNGDLAGIFYMLDKISGENGITITITCSCTKEEMPDFVAKYA